MSNATQTLTVTRRSRIGFSWTNSPERWTGNDGQSHLRISDPGDVPQVTGYPSVVAAEYQKVARLNSGNDWARRWFVRSEGKWIPIRLSAADLWILLENYGKDYPRTDSIEVQVV